MIIVCYTFRILSKKKYGRNVYDSKKLTKQFVAMISALAMTLTFLAVPTEAVAKRVKLNKTKLSMKQGGTYVLKLSGKGIQSVSWKVSNSKIVTVKKKGLKKATIKGKKIGKTKVKALVKLKGQKKKKVLTCTVTVKKAKSVPEQNKNTVSTPTPITVPNATSTPTPVLTPSASPMPPIATPMPIPQEDLALCSYPMLFTDMPDVYMCRKGDTYYMISTTMFLNPGAPIVKSIDLVHWQIAGYVYDKLEDDDYGNMDNGKDMYSHGSWAAALVYNEKQDLFYVCFNTANEGCYFFTTKDIESGNWKRYKSTVSFHDPGILFEGDKMYVFANNSSCSMSQVELVEDDDGDGVGKAVRVGTSKKIITSDKYDGIEGWHPYHIGDYYYVLAIGTPKGRWYRTEICYRTKDLLNGKWEEQVVYSGSSGGYKNQGLAQGGIIQTPAGDWYAYLFQDHESIGRCPSVVEVNWDYTDKKGVNYKDWPMMGTYDENGVFQANKSEKPIRIKLKDSGLDNYLWGDDDFDYKEGEKLKLVWQWNHNPEPENWSVTEKPGYYRIRSGRLASNVYGAKNSLTQRTYGPKCVSETKINVAGLKSGDYAGLCAFQDSYGIIGVTCGADGKKYIVQGEGKFDEQEDGYYNKVPVTENERVSEALTTDEVIVKIEYDFSYTSTSIKDTADFYYSLDDGKTWNVLGKQLKITNNYQTVFMGARSYLFMYSTEQTGGYADFDYYKIYDK